MSSNQQTSMAGYKAVSDTYKEIIDCITSKDLPQIKLYIVGLGKKIAARENQFFSEFKDVKDLFDNIKEAKGKSPIHFAVARGDLSIVKYLIEDVKVDYHVKDKQNNTPFFTAVAHGFLDIVRYFVEELGQSPYATKDGEIGTLHVAASQNHVDIIQYLLSKGCDIQKISIYGKPINWAIGSRSVEATKVLLQNGADANGDPTYSVPPPIFIAIDFQSQQIFEALLSASKPANVNSKDPQGYSPLHFAAQKGNLAMVKQLIEKGAEPNLQVQGKTPLYFAFENSKWDVVSYLRTFTKNHEEIEAKIKAAKIEQQSQQKAHPINKEKANELKNEGNKLYGDKKYEEALKVYFEALKFDEENEVIHRNIAACYLPLHRYSQALEHCHKAKLVDPKNVKTIYRQAQAYIGLNNLVEASASLWQCAMLEPDTIFFQQEFKKYSDLAKKAHQQSST